MLEAENWRLSTEGPEYLEHGLIGIRDDNTGVVRYERRVGELDPETGRYTRVNLKYNPASGETVVYISHTHPLPSPFSFWGQIRCNWPGCGNPRPTQQDVNIMKNYPGAYGVVQSRHGNYYLLGN